MLTICKIMCCSRYGFKNPGPPWTFSQTNVTMYCYFWILYFYSSNQFFFICYKVKIFFISDSNQYIVCQIISLNSNLICFSTDLAMTRRNPLDFIGKSPLPPPPPRCCAFSFLVLDGFPICRADKGLGLSIAGGLGSTPYKECRHLRYGLPP